MFSIISTSALVLAAASSVSAISVGHSGFAARRSHADLAARNDPPAGWAAGYLEDYHVYHTRYIALDCQDKHNDSFFDACCHPLLATESLSIRPAKCTPAPAASSSAAKIEPTSTIGTPADSDDEDEDCEDEDDDGSSSAPAPKSTAAPKATPAPVNAAPKAAPKEETSEAPKPTSTKEAPAPAPTSSAPASSGSGSGLIKGGFGTFFFQNGVAGACGKVNSDSTPVVAMDSARYGSGGLCGKHVKITNTKNGKSVTALVADECPTCVNGNSIDMSTGAFNQIATPDEGMVPIEWTFV